MAGWSFSLACICRRTPGLCTESFLLLLFYLPCEDEKTRFAVLFRNSPKGKNGRLFRQQNVEGSVLINYTSLRENQIKFYGNEI